MSDCKLTTEVNAVYFINPKDIKAINEKDGLVFKRKYGEHKREVYKYVPKNKND